MKRILLVICALLLVGCVAKWTPLMEYGEFSKIKPSNITSIDVVKYTVAGDTTTHYEEPNDIENIYNALNKKQVGPETTQACEDNTTVYKINLIDSSIVTIEIECEWVVIGQKRYLVK